MGCNERSIVPRFSREEIADAVSRGRLLTMEVEFNRNCNFNCVYCYAENSPATGEELTREEFRDVITQGRDLGARTMVILGGEPMLYPHLGEMVRFMRGLALEVEIFTNGANMTVDAAAELFELGVTVVLKMNTFDEKLQEALSGRPGAYGQIWTAFENLKGAGYPGPEGRLGVGTIICSRNYEELEKLWRWLRRQGVTPYFEMITPQGRARDREELFVEPWKAHDLFTRLAGIDREFGYHWSPQPPIAGMECLRHQYSCVVTPTGVIYPCVGLDISVGSVRERGLADIIRESEVLKNLRNYRENIKGPCRRCEKFHGCYGCRGAAYQLTGDYLASDPMCWMNAGLKDAISSLPAEAVGLVPHKPPMLVLERLLEVKESSTAEVKVSEDMVFVGEDGVLDDVAYLEMLAQAMAAHTGFMNVDNGGAPEGLLVGVKGLAVHGHARVGDTLKIVVGKVAQYGSELAVVRGEVFRNGTRLAEGEITVWQNNLDA
jgi:radical SAM protein with 4Fe4S-binding SPASM domain